MLGEQGCVSSLQIKRQTVQPLTNLVREERHIDFEPTLHACKLVGVLLVSNEADCQTFCAEASSTPNTVQVLVTRRAVTSRLLTLPLTREIVCTRMLEHHGQYVLGKRKPKKLDVHSKACTRKRTVDDDIHALNVDATAEEIRGHKDAFLEIFEVLVLGNTECKQRSVGGDCTSFGL